MSEICLDCRSPYSLTEAEEKSFKSLMGKLKDFKMPKRCSPCRALRRNGVQPPPVFVAAPAIPMGRASTLDMKIKVNPGLPGPVPAKAPVHFVLGTGDFEALVSGQPLVWNGVTIVLADIGFKAMYDAIERAEVARISASHKRPAPKPSGRVNG
jgi:hypothetical protein